MARFSIGQWSKEEAARRALRRIENDRLDTLPLKLYGQSMDDLYNEYPKLLTLSEVAICASPATLRDLAKHLLDAADRMEKADEDVLECGWHEHWRTSRPDVIVCNVRPEDEESAQPITGEEHFAEWKRRQK